MTRDNCKDALRARFVEVRRSGIRAQSGLALTDNARIFEHFFGHFGIESSRQENLIITDFHTGDAVVVTRMTLQQNMFHIKDMDFDAQGKIRRINGVEFGVERY